MARVTTAPCSSPNERMPPASALIGAARVDAMVRATRADGASGPWSIAATRQASSSSASASLGASPATVAAAWRGRGPSDGLVQGDATHEHPLLGRGRDARGPARRPGGSPGALALVDPGHRATW